jgi:hypothetical protein
MRKVVFGANSLDNYFTRKDHSTDWLRWSNEAAAVTAAYWKRFDTVLMGRKTYEVALRHSNGKAPYRDKQTFAVSRTCTDDAGGAPRPGRRGGSSPCRRASAFAHMVWFPPRSNRSGTRRQATCCRMREQHWIESTFNGMM